MQHALRLREVTKNIKDKFRLGPLNLEIEPGFIVAVVGPNGSGKTTLFRMLMGMLQPDVGEIKFYEQQYPLDEVAIKRKIGYIPETSENQKIFTTVADALQFAAFWYPSWDAAYCQELLKKFEITPTDKLSGLSKGTRRKVDLILALAFHPELLLLDEPSSGLDPFAWKLMLEELTRFMERGQRTVFMATHIMEEVRRLADYVVFLYQGKLLGYYEKDALLDGWKSIWIDRLPNNAENIAGVVTVEQDQSIKLISESPQETLAALASSGINVIKTLSVDLDEIFMYLLQKSKD